MSGHRSAPQLEVHHHLPPLTVVGDSRHPYLDPEPGTWVASRNAEAWARHAATRLPLLEVGTVAEVRLRGFPRAFYRRRPGRPWRVDNGGIAIWVSTLVNRGLLPPAARDAREAERHRRLAREAQAAPTTPIAQARGHQRLSFAEHLTSTAVNAVTTAAHEGSLGDVFPGTVADPLTRVAAWHDLLVKVRATLQASLDDQQWFYPTRMPMLTGPLERILTDVLGGHEPGTEGAWATSPDEIYPAERAEAERLAADRRFAWRDESYEPWKSRESRRRIEVMIAASGRATPYRLRPVVLTNENAARRQWHYGGWLVYDVLASGDIGACLALYGKGGRSGSEENWQTIAWNDGFPRPLPIIEEGQPEIRWYGHVLDDHGGYGSPTTMTCALTGDVIAHNGRPAPESRRRDTVCFLPAEPPADRTAPAVASYDEARVRRARG